MSSTYATDANIHAVSPELILSKATSTGSVGAAGVAAAAAAADGTGASWAQTTELENASKPKWARRNGLIFNANPLDSRHLMARNALSVNMPT